MARAKKIWRFDATNCLQNRPKNDAVSNSASAEGASEENLAI